MVMNVKEALHAVKGTNATTHIGLDDKGSIGKGSEGDVHSVNALWTDRIGHLLQRRFVHKVLQRPEEATMLQDVYRKCKDAGLPVPATFRVTKRGDGSPKGLLITDLTEGGEKVVVSIESFLGNKNHLLSSDYQEFKTRFLDFDLSNNGEIAQQLERYSHLAAAHGIAITHFDAWFLVFGKEGSPQLKLADFGSVAVCKSAGKDSFEGISMRGSNCNPDFLPVLQNRMTQQNLLHINQHIQKGFMNEMFRYKMLMGLGVLKPVMKIQGILQKLSA